MARTLLVLAVLLTAGGAILTRLWAMGFSLAVAIKMIALAAGFVVSIKLVLGGYLALRGATDPTAIQLVGFYGALGLTVFFGVATLSVWRRGGSRSSPDGRPRGT